MEDLALIEQAQKVCRSRQLSDECIAGEVGAVLLSAAGRVYVGVSISAACGIGFCAEHSAVAQMVTAGETRIRKLAAVSADGMLLPPCGRCRELLYQVDRGNLETEVILAPGETVRLAELLPRRWQETWT